tara:strand:- start:42 stop:410 length:369 start_codon:yes stop_codon:yes gene_type:complete
MLNEECEKRLSDIMDDSGDAGFEFIAPSSLADAKNKIAKMMMFYLGNIGREFDLARWNDAERKRMVKASSYFFKVFDKKTIVEKYAHPSRMDGKKESDVEILVENYEINEDTLTLNDYLMEE